MTIPLLPPPGCKSAARPYKRTSAAAFVGEQLDPDDPLLGFEPYIHAAPRRNSITPDRQRAFIAALAATGIVTQAARMIGASLEALYNLRNRKGAEGFAAAWEQALDRGVLRLEDCALERAIQGQQRIMVNRAGEVVAEWTQYDTALITFILRQRRPERYGLGGGIAGLRPGHPIYERLRREWEREAALTSHVGVEEVRASIMRKLEQLREEVETDYARSGDDEAGGEAPGSDEASASAAEPRGGRA